MKFLAACLLSVFSMLGTTYEVGPGKQYADPVALPWGSLTDGDTIKVYWREEPYRNLFFIGWSNFSLIGVPGPNGQKPIIDGDGAVAVTRGISYYNQDRGLVRIGESAVPQIKYLENILVEGFEFRNAWRTNATPEKPANRGYHGQDTPNVNQSWADNAAGVQATGVKNLTVRNNIFHEMKIGVQVNSSYPARVSTNCVVENNEFYTIGSDDQSHVLYLECNREIIRNNKSTQPAGWSSVFKSRGACTNIYNNEIIGGDRVADLVDRAEMRALNPTCPDFFANNYVERFHAIDNDAFIHFGGDGKDAATNDLKAVANYRQNTLYVLNNTFLSRRIGSVLVRVSAWNQKVVALNNVFQWANMARGGFVLALHNEYRRIGPSGEKSKISYGSNWLQKGSCSDPTAAMYLCGRVGDLDVTDLGGNTWAVSTGAENTPPSATPGWGSDYRPLYNSPLLDGGLMPAYEGVDWTFGGMREVVNGKIDIGAYEYGSAKRPGIQVVASSTPPVITLPSTSTPTTPPVTTPPSTSSTPTSTAIEQSISQLKGLVDAAAKAKKIADDAAAAANAAITEAKAAAARAEYDATTVADKYVQQIRKVLEDAGLK